MTLCFFLLKTAHLEVEMPRKEQMQSYNFYYIRCHHYHTFNVHLMFLVHNKKHLTCNLKEHTYFTMLLYTHTCFCPDIFVEFNEKSKCYVITFVTCTFKNIIVIKDNYKNGKT